jgi:hypothetical protein
MSNLYQPSPAVLAIPGVSFTHRGETLKSEDENGKRKFRQHTMRIDSAQALSALAKAPAASDWDTKYQSRVERGNGNEFTGGATFDDAAALNAEGWPEGRRRMLQTLAIAAPAASLTAIPAIMMDVAGLFPTVPAAVAGDPACMVSFNPDAERQRPVVRLSIKMGGSGNFNQSEFFNFGTAVVAVIDALEGAGYRCEIEAVNHARSRGNDSRSTYRLMVKEAQDVVDLDRIAFVFAHAGAFRRLGFAAIERTAPAADFRGHLGIPDQAVRGVDFDDGQIYMAGLNAFKRSDLAKPDTATKAFATLVQAGLADLYADPPRLNWDWAGGEPRAAA